ncbi:MAG: GNAT family N-acetyltransferase [Anaerolineae bacterium]|nr:GNAT family N-acetyltransferase [Anaerolineae bacterium]
MPSYSFRRLNDDDFEDAYAIIVEVTQWLLNKGIRQWVEPFPTLLYAQRHVMGENFGLFVDNQLASVVSLIDDRPEYWSEYLPKTRFKWLATLATSRSYKGQKLGELTMVEAEQFLAREGVPAVYLDCIFGDGTLPVFYSSMGYKLVARKDVTFPHGTFDSVLMRKRLNHR